MLAMLMLSRAWPDPSKYPLIFIVNVPKWTIIVSWQTFCNFYEANTRIGTIKKLRSYSATLSWETRKLFQSTKWKQFLQTQNFSIKRNSRNATERKVSHEWIFYRFLTRNPPELGKLCLILTFFSKVSVSKGLFLPNIFLLKAKQGSRKSRGSSAHKV